MDILLVWWLWAGARSPAGWFAIARPMSGDVAETWVVACSEFAMRPRAAVARAFTLIELLVVIVIIGVLLALTLSLGPSLIGSGKRSVTQDTLKILDAALSAYIAEKGGPPEPFVEDPRLPRSQRDGRFVIPVADARNFSSGAAADRVVIDTVGLFLLQAKESREASKVIDGLNPKMIRGLDPVPGASNLTAGDAQVVPALRTVLDGWGNPIRYVHPAFRGAINARTEGGGNSVDPVPVSAILGNAPAGKSFGVTQIRRTDLDPANISAGTWDDADGGSPKNDRGYFYSAGPDGNPATLEDNVYLVQPTLPKRP
jgi:prepilin-type N-terminal cleavage/methylation domain-containing protein